MHTTNHQFSVKRFVICMLVLLSTFIAFVGWGAILCARRDRVLFDLNKFDCLLMRGDLRKAKEQLAELSPDVDKHEVAKCREILSAREKQVHDFVLKFRIADLSIPASERLTLPRLQLETRDLPVDRELYDTLREEWGTAEGTVDQLAVSLAGLADALSANDFATADAHFKRASDCLPASSPTVSTLTEVITSAEQKYLSELRRMLQSVVSAINDHNSRAARDELKQAQVTHAANDQLLFILARYIDRVDNQKIGVSQHPRKVVTWDVEATIKAARDWQKSLSADDNQWPGAFRELAARHPQSLFAVEKESLLIDIEIARVVRGQHGKLPRAKMHSIANGRTYSIENVSNQTDYKLRILYSGPESFVVNLQPRQNASIEMRRGRYHIAAKVGNPRVIPYAGETMFDVGNYESEYDIRTSSDFRLNPPVTIIQFGSPPPFEQWPCIRRVSRE